MSALDERVLDIDYEREAERIAARLRDITARTLPATRVATLAVGPEGGLSDHDHATLRQAGFRGLRLGPRILRTETAGLAALAALQALHGDLR